MGIEFYKYEGAGNDFVLIDNRDKGLNLSPKEVAFLCDRRFGVGGDGLILLSQPEEPDCDFKMTYYNSDGNLSSFCGNGGRCIAHFAGKTLKITGASMNFMAFDGKHSATINKDDTISLSMMPVSQILFGKGFTQLDTGSPHYVKIVEGLSSYPVVQEGRRIRTSPAYKKVGINVNFMEADAKGLNHIRTYERGVEDETYACGTGVTACAIASVGTQIGKFTVPIISKKGHSFKVDFVKTASNKAEEIILTGPVNRVFQGKVELPK